MSKQTNEAGRWPVPADWDEEVDGYLCYTLCVPNSRGWRTIVDGQISSMAYGRNYNRFSGSIQDAQAIAREVFESMCAAKCDDIVAALQCICESVTTLAGKTEDTGQEVEQTPSDGQITVGPDEQFPDQDAYFNAKCSVANGVYDTVLGLVDWLDGNLDDVTGGDFGGVTSGILLGINTVGVFGWAWAKTLSFLASLAGLLISLTVDFEDLSDALVDTHEDCVRSLYNASNAVIAEANFIATVEAGTPTIGVPEQLILAALVTSDMINELFAPREASAEYNSPSPIDCDTFSIQVWSFVASGEGWSFEDVSEGTQSSSGQWVSAREAWEVRLVGTAGGGGDAAGRVYLDGLAIGVTAENSVRVDYGATSGGENVFIYVLVTFSDVTTVEGFSSGHDPGPGTVIVTMPGTKTVEEISVRASHEEANFDYTVDIEEVRVQ